MDLEQKAAVTKVSYLGWSRESFFRFSEIRVVLLDVVELESLLFLEILLYAKLDLQGCGVIFSIVLEPEL